MTRPTRAYIDTNALLHNLEKVKSLTNNKKIVAMVKANAYGCGLPQIIPALDGKVFAFGVASIEEAHALRKYGSESECILFQGVFSSEELDDAINSNFQCVIHNHHQLEMFLQNQNSKAIKVWVKVDTAMHRLGFKPEEVTYVIDKLRKCPIVKPCIGIMTHLACADIVDDPVNQKQLDIFNNLSLPAGEYIYSVANSAAILSNKNTHKDVVRPGIILYGVSPFAEKKGIDLGLKPVMNLYSAISNFADYPENSRIGYGGVWETKRKSRIAIVPIGYGDGYPRHIENAFVYLNNQRVPIVGRVSMDMLSIDVTDCPNIQIGDKVELWGKNIAVEEVAKAANTIAYELICQISPRVIKENI